jgi:hypothetical protein
MNRLDRLDVQILTSLLFENLNRYQLWKKLDGYRYITFWRHIQRLSNDTYIGFFTIRNKPSTIICGRKIQKLFLIPECLPKKFALSHGLRFKKSKSMDMIFDWRKRRPV